MSDLLFQYISENLNYPSRFLFLGDDLAGGKTYDRYPLVSLKTPSNVLGISLVDALSNRKSIREFDERSMSLDQLSQWLFYSARQVNSQGTRSAPFPSGGALYPIDNYVLSIAIDGLERGVYHYDSYSHGLRKLPQNLYDNDKLSRVFKYTNHRPNGILCMTMSKHRNFPKYGLRGYLLSLLEAGHRMQNLQLVASASDLGCCSLGAADFDEVNRLLAVDGVNEHYIYSTTVGLKK